MSRRVLLYNTTPPFNVVLTGTNHSLTSTTTVTITGIPAGVTFIGIPVVFDTASSVTLPTINDGRGNSYSVTTKFGLSTSTIWNAVCWVANPSTASSMSFVVSVSGGSAVSAAVLICTGANVPTPTLDQSNGTNGVAAGSSSLATGSVTPLFNGELIVALAATGTGSTGTPPAVTGYTLIHIPFVLGSVQGLVVYYKVQPIIQAENVTFAGTNMKYFGAIIATFKN